MCGIAGWITGAGAEPPADVLARMSAAIRHRGPDDDGMHRDPAAGVALAFRRLSIIDLSSASHQPMLDAATGVALVYNGELYNFRTLRAELEALGHSFASRGDGEVVLRSYLQWGSDCFERFAGMFGLAIWDPRSRQLLLARDPLGMKPVYYTDLGGGIAFASELKAFRELPDFALRMSEHGLRQYLEFGYVFDESATIIEGVRKLPPGHWMRVGEGRRELRAYFQPPAPDPQDRRGEKERVDELQQVLETVTAEHLVADVPVGLLLSGGLDSSLVSGLAARRGPLLTICMSFSRSAIDERPQAAAVARHIGSRHLELDITPQQVMEEVRTGAWVFDDLFADWGTITTRLMYRRCREQGVKVVLVGEGADELFGGYGWFDAPQPMGLFQKFRLYQRYAGRRFGGLFGEFRSAFNEYLAEGAGDSFHAVRLFESRRQLPNQYVMKVDKASMAESIEARAPYLDRRVAELAFRTPREWLLREGSNKYLMRALAQRENLVPEQISARPKFGGSVAASWMDEDAGFRAFARERLVDGAWSRHVNAQSAMRKYFDQGRSGDPFPRPISIFSNLAWRLLLLELWAEHYLQAPSRA